MISLLVFWSLNPGGRTDPWHPKHNHSTLRSAEFSSLRGAHILTPSGSKFSEHPGLYSIGVLLMGVVSL